MPDQNGIPNPHTDTAEWVRFKRRRIGGHAAVTLCGASYSSAKDKHYKTPSQLYDLIVHGIVDPITAEKERFFAWRIKQEPLIADRYTEETGRKLRRCGSSVHPENEMLLCSPDREILNDPRGMGLLEVKSRDPIAWRLIKLHGIPGADWVQNQFYMMCRGVKWGAIVQGNLSTGELIREDIKADLQFHALMMDQLNKFIGNCANGIRPPETIEVHPDIPVVGGELVTTDQMSGQLVAEFRTLAMAAVEARNLRDRAKSYYEDVKETTKKWMEGNDFDVVEGFGARIYNKMGKGKAGFNRKGLQQAKPDLDLTPFETRGKPHRNFKVYDRPLALKENGE